MNPNLPGGKVQIGAQSGAMLTEHQLRLGFGVSFGLLDRRKSGAHATANVLNEKIFSTFYRFEIGYSIVRGLAVELDLPVGAIFVQDNTTRRTHAGLGDLALLASYDFKWFYRKHKRAPHVQLGAGISFPTGKRLTESPDQGPNQLAIGRGTFDFVGRLALLWPVADRWKLLANVSVQIPLNDAAVVTLGNAYQYGLGVHWQFWPKRMGAQLRVDFEKVSRSREAAMGTLLNSGGDSIHVGLGVNVTIVERLVWSLSAQVPVYQFVNGTQQVSRFSLSTGLSYRFKSFSRKR